MCQSCEHDKVLKVLAEVTLLANDRYLEIHKLTAQIHDLQGNLNHSELNANEYFNLTQEQEILIKSLRDRLESLKTVSNERADMIIQKNSEIYQLQRKVRAYKHFADTFGAELELVREEVEKGPERTRIL